MELYELTLQEALRGVESKEFSAREVNEALLKRIASQNPKLKAYLSVAPSPSDNLSVAVKDNILTREFTTTAASLVLQSYQPSYNASLVERLLKANFSVLGKTNLDAWAHGSSTETSDFGPTLNPWNLEKLPGGSSGGSAAAVAADLCLASLGTETAGSIRQPASWCGVVGLKPTYGRVSRYGVIAMASSTDSPGPITKTVWDAAYLLSIIAGADPFDATTSLEPVKPYHELLAQTNLKAIKIGLPASYFANCEKRVAEAVREASKVLENHGARLFDVELLTPKYALAVYTILQRSEVSSNLARYDGVRYGQDRSSFGAEAKRRIILGTYALSAGYYEAYYEKAEKTRTLILQDFERVFKEVDLILAPVSPTTALSLGASQDEAMFGEKADVLVEGSAMAGLPGISLPCGFVDDLPVGLGLIGPRFSEELLLKTAYKYEQETDWHKIRPKTDADL